MRKTLALRNGHASGNPPRQNPASDFTDIPCNTGGRRRQPHGPTTSHNSHRWKAPLVKIVADDFTAIRGGKDEPHRTTSWPHALRKSRTDIGFLTHAKAAANNWTYRSWANEEPHGAPFASNDLANLHTAIGHKLHVNIVAGDLAKRRWAKGKPQGNSTMPTIRTSHTPVSYSKSTSRTSLATPQIDAGPKRSPTWRNDLGSRSITIANVSQQRAQFPTPENGLIFGSAETRLGATDPRGPARP
jgi:hypothetical protein